MDRHYIKIVALRTAIREILEHFRMQEAECPFCELSESHSDECPITTVNKYIGELD